MKIVSPYITMVNMPLLSRTELEQQISVRRELLEKVVGTFYPGKLTEEISQIGALLDQRG